MEIHAYSEEYVLSAQRVVGDMFDFAIVTLGLDADWFAAMFKSSDVSLQIGCGNPAYVAGHNGCELARMILESNGIDTTEAQDVMYIDKSPEFWSGWATAYYQWETGSTFQYVFNNICLSRIIEMYGVYHEMDIENYVCALDTILRETSMETRLQYYRKKLGLSQSQLASKSDVPIRQIQLFEQRKREINRTQADTLLKLSKALYCNMEDLLEQG
ncbi:MAG: helix-turn-helix transcriptional regulator [Eubacterium sp.]|nr:helix-turn-helix transcriptional regulator [Eubacterium sp.]